MEAENQKVAPSKTPGPAASPRLSPSQVTRASSTPPPPIVPSDTSEIPDPHPERRLLDVGNEALMNKCRAFVEQLRDGAAPWIVQKLNESYGNMPTDASSFTFWVALVRFLVHCLGGPRRRVTGFSPGPSDRRIRKSQAAADQKC